MKRLMVYPGAIPLETDLLNIQRNTMISVSKFAELLFGVSNTVLCGLRCNATVPPSLQVDIAPGQIYESDMIDAYDFGSLPADIDHAILKQGILLDKLTLNCAAPVAIGCSVNYLIEVAFQEVDEVPVVLPYYNASNPAVAYSGPNNSGTGQNTSRSGKCIVLAKAGVPATTGTQTTPAADVGYTGIWVVTVAYDQIIITAANISSIPSAPFYNAGFVVDGVPLPIDVDNSAGPVIVTLPSKGVVLITVLSDSGYDVTLTTTDGSTILRGAGTVINGQDQFIKLMKVDNNWREC